MAREFGDRIRDIVSDHSHKLHTEEGAAKLQAEDEQRFLADYSVASERFIVPVLKGLEDFSNDTVKFLAYSNNTSAGVQVSAQLHHNKIVFEANPRGRQVTVTTNDRNPDNVELSQITKEWVESEVEKRVAGLIQR